MIKNFKELVNQIKTQVPIQELISEYVPVKKSGRGYACVCPFHDDHNPSLQIHPQKGIFKCFSCGTGGDLITFYALINKKKWSEAVPELAVKYGLKVEYGEENKAEVEIKTKLYELNRCALDFFKKNLFLKDNSDSAIAYEYVANKRKLKPDILEKYEVGYAQNSWDSLYNYLTKEKKYQQELIVASGLFIPRENLNTYYDRFRNRVIFPIYNEKNNIIGFGGRTLSNDDAKYINSPETLIFNKGFNLYGLNFAKDEIKNQDYVILTEGYLDVITAHQYGLLNTVATLGTAFTKEQARLLAKYTDSKRVFLSLDTDAAGQKAVQKAYKVAQEVSKFVNLDFKVVTGLPAKDLDESLNLVGEADIRKVIEDSQPLTKFVLDRISGEYNQAKSEIEKKEKLDELLDVIITTSDPIEKKDNINYSSHKLNIDEELINLKLKEKNKLKKSVYKKKESKVVSDDEMYKMHTIERFKHAELELLTLYINSFPYSDSMKEELSKVEFIDEKNKLIKDYLDNLLVRNLSPQDLIEELIIEFNEFKNIMSTISSIAIKIENDSTNTDKAYKQKVLIEAKEWIKWWIQNKQKMKFLTEQLKECKNADEENDILLKMINLVRGNEEE